MDLSLDFASQLDGEGRKLDFQEVECHQQVWIARSTSV